jgi:hypothetical protein
VPQIFSGQQKESVNGQACRRLPLLWAGAPALFRDVIDLAARTVRYGRDYFTLHLAEGWHRHTEWLNLFEAACGPPAAAA